MSLLNKGLTSVAISTYINWNRFIQTPIIVSQVRNYAARKGTREKRAKAKVKVEVQKIGFIPHNQRNKEKFLLNRPKCKFDDSWKQLPLDNVYPQKYYQWRVYPFIEAVECHRETHHPEVYNKPNANLHVSIELNMEGEKKTKFMDNFTRIAPMPNKFEHGEERAIIAFTKEPEMQEKARQAGAQMAGGLELIREIQNGAISLHDFQFIVAHPTILAELITLRGLMKKKFPNPKLGTLDDDVPALVAKFINGLSYTATKDEYEKDFGLIETIIGTLDMKPEHLEENFASLIEDIYKVKPKRSGSFISRCLLWSPPSSEKLKVDYNLYLKNKPEASQSSNEDEKDSENVESEKIKVSL